MNPRWPVYVISKGRWKQRQTVRALEAIGVPYFVAVEPVELEQYAEVIPRERLIELPFSDLGLGATPARNVVWDHARASGVDWHWILDDNIRGFYRLNYNLKTPVADGTIFRAAEDFVERYENVGVAGFNYFMFAPRKVPTIPPFYLNTRVYSHILLRTDLPYEWRGPHEEDTDLCLQALKDGWTTVLFNTFLCDKVTTMTMGGGNSPLYEGEGRLEKELAIVNRHPDLARVGWRFGHVQHVVYYKGFRQKLKLREGVRVREGVDDYGMRLERLIDGAWRPISREQMHGPIELEDGRVVDLDPDDVRRVEGRFAWYGTKGGRGSGKPTRSLDELEHEIEGDVDVDEQEADRRTWSDVALPSFDVDSSELEQGSLI